MAKKNGISRYTSEQLSEMIRHGESQTDWEKVRATTKAELEASIAADPDEPQDVDWTQAFVGMPSPKQDIHIRLDADILNWFKATGRGYQTRINAVLRAFVESRKHNPG
jgi:uncharacterized protein (DUF4415 family)